MSVRAIGNYDFPSRSRQELYGEDQLVHVLWRGNSFLCAAATFRAPRAMPFGEFVAAIVEPWAASDPDFTPGSEDSWQLDGRAIEPKPDESLADLGVGHKHLLSFAVTA
jgi:Phenol hydroxylase conserved region